MEKTMSAQIISFPMNASAPVEQQRWIPAPRARRSASRSLVGWLRLTGVLLAIISSWSLVIGTAHLISIIL
jgi:hypothetical protein